MKTLLTIFFICSYVYAQTKPIYDDNKLGKALDLDGSTESIYFDNPTNLGLDLALKLNSVNNSTMESATDFLWANKGDPTGGRSTEQKKSGSYSLKITSSKAGDSTANFTYLPNSAYGGLEVNKKYKQTFYLRPTENGTSVFFKCGSSTQRFDTDVLTTVATSVNVKGHQGCAVPPVKDRIYVFDTGKIRKLTLGLAVVDSNANIVNEVGDGLVHCGDGDVVADTLYLPFEAGFKKNESNRATIVMYDTNLVFISKTDVSAYMPEITAISCDSLNNILYAVSYIVPNKIYKFNLKTKAFIGTISLAIDIDKIQGIVKKGNYFYISNDYKKITRFDLDGTNPNILHYNSALAPYEGMDFRGDTLYMITSSATSSGFLQKCILGMQTSFLYLSNVFTATNTTDSVKIWLNKATSVYLDVYTINQCKDAVIMYNCKILKTGNVAVYDVGQTGSSAGRYMLNIKNYAPTFYLNTNNVAMDLASSYSLQNRPNSFVYLIIEHGRYAKLYCNGELILYEYVGHLGSFSALNVNPNRATLGAKNTSSSTVLNFQGDLGRFTQFTFDNISLSNAKNESMILAISKHRDYTSKISGGGAIKVIDFDWEGNDTNTILTNKATSDIWTSSNVDLTDVVKNKYYK